MKPATPLPWQSAQYETFSNIVQGQKRIGSSFKHQDAAYIVHACNAYPELVAALRDMTRYDSVSEPGAYGYAITTARALLAKLGEIT